MVGRQVQYSIMIMLQSNKFAKNLNEIYTPETAMSHEGQVLPMGEYYQQLSNRWLARKYNIVL